MKAEDLMNGDWVKYIMVTHDAEFVGDLIVDKGQSTTEHIIKIDSVNDSGVFFKSKKFDESLIFVSMKDLEPILLTEEILEKNGFKKDKDYGYFIGQSNSGYYIYLDNNYLSIQAGYDAIEFAWCEYVHELQQALKLCGITKSIKL